MSGLARLIFNENVAHHYLVNNEKKNKSTKKKKELSVANFQGTAIFSLFLVSSRLIFQIHHRKQKKQQQQKL